jgi:hypothetical protein
MDEMNTTGNLLNLLPRTDVAMAVGLSGPEQVVEAEIKLRQLGQNFYAKCIGIIDETQWNVDEDSCHLEAMMRIYLAGCAFMAVIEAKDDLPRSNGLLRTLYGFILRMERQIGITTNLDTFLVQRANGIDLMDGPRWSAIDELKRTGLWGRSKASKSSPPPARSTFAPPPDFAAD